MDFKGKDIDRVLSVLKEDGGPLYASELQKKHLPDWQLLKVESIFKFLYENYKHRFDWHVYNVDYNGGYGLQYSQEWDVDLDKGGFDTYWRPREKAKLEVSEILKGVGVGSGVINTVIRAIPFFQ